MGNSPPQQEKEQKPYINKYGIENPEENPIGNPIENPIVNQNKTQVIEVDDQERQNQEKLADLFRQANENYEDLFKEMNTLDKQLVDLCQDLKEQIEQNTIT